MIVYFDSSVFLRLALDQRPQLGEWDEVTIGVASVVALVECRRTVDRHSWTGVLTAAAANEAMLVLDDILSRVEVANVDDGVIRRAAGAFPRPLKSLDAIHLATAFSIATSSPMTSRPSDSQRTTHLPP